MKSVDCISICWLASSSDSFILVSYKRGRTENVCNAQEEKREEIRVKRAKERKKDYEDRLQAFELEISTTDTSKETDENITVILSCQCRKTRK